MLIFICWTHKVFYVRWLTGWFQLVHNKNRSYVSMYSWTKWHEMELLNWASLSERLDVQFGIKTPSFCIKRHRDESEYSVFCVVFYSQPWFKVVKSQKYKWVLRGVSYFIDTFLFVRAVNKDENYSGLIICSWLLGVPQFSQFTTFGKTCKRNWDTCVQIGL